MATKQRKSSRSNAAKKTAKTQKERNSEAFNKRGQKEGSAARKNQ